MENDNTLISGSWERFKGENLDTGCLVFLKDNGIGFINSSLSSKEPDCISSIPEEWSFDNILINKRDSGDYGDSYIRKDGWIFKDKDSGGKKIDRILYYSKILKPVFS